MHVLLIEPYCTGSHAAWVEGFRQNSTHSVSVLELGGGNWKWRMHGGAVTTARRYWERDGDPDVILATDMLDLTTFQSLTRARTAAVPMAVYFHENQLSYPWSPTDRDVIMDRDKHYGFINYTSALAADAVYFNSEYHLRSFFGELDRLLKHFPDHNELATIETIRQKTSVLRLGIDLRRFDAHADAKSVADDTPVVLWNHRWEYDKNPDVFFAALKVLAGRGLKFQVAILGESFSQMPVSFIKAKEVLGERIVQFGYVEEFSGYARWLQRADILPVTSVQDFFGAGVTEAVYCGCRPLLPERLAYPELIPEKHHAAVFYQDFDDLVARLELMVREGRKPINEELTVAMSRFDWETMAPIYDGALETVARVAERDARGSLA